MGREKLISLAIGLAVVLAAAGGVLWMNRGSRLILDGSIQKVRTQALDDACALVVDFRLKNPSKFRYVVGKVELFADLDGNWMEGAVVADIDAQRFFHAYPAIGQKFNDTLRMREKLDSGQTVDRMLAARFEVPESKLLSRRNLKIRIEEVDGVVTEIFEKPR
ncbi:MAG: hypothetical protein NZV14_11050 [Bryobacteraceae bacterium]|nr:hypothetical protein [Bryobacteraceae bacterium]MDW8378689.1 hypothetical protein [Bryobacterales bacterium]